MNDSSMALKEIIKSEFMWSILFTCHIILWTIKPRFQIIESIDRWYTARLESNPRSPDCAFHCHYSITLFLCPELCEHMTGLPLSLQCRGGTDIHTWGEPNANTAHIFWRRFSYQRFMEFESATLRISPWLIFIVKEASLSSGTLPRWSQEWEQPKSLKVSLQQQS